VITLWVRGVQSLGNLQRRLLACIFAITGPKFAYRLTGWGAKAIYKLLDPLRMRSEAQCRAALHDKVPANDIPRIADQSFINRARNMTDLMLAPRLLHPATFARYGGQIPEPFLTELLDGQRHRQPTILVTAYYGSFDLLPIFLGYNGIQASAVYLPHANKSYDDFRRKIRGQSGCDMIPVHRALTRLNQVLRDGGTVALLVDHHDEDRGMAVKFLGLDAKMSRSIGLLAWRHHANVVVAALRRLDDTFRFQFVIADVIYHQEAAVQSDHVEFITHRYLRAIEGLIMEDPTQYLWAYARWGEEHARQVAELRRTF
jgi:Kdo2-lipid IVA lauroyltransferase/acyltransferase